ncbi:MAG: rhodanese-like domain-containing protein [Chitinophagaceae bacterium]|jgi:rhodanese-related sulfurtransferase|nr:MAG: rhodanese-like domain-containing protein [Chitinophagaceae bacterium]
MKNFIVLFFLTITFTSCAGSVNNENVQNVSALDLQEVFLNGSEYLVIDLRTPQEFNRGHIENAININFYGNDFWDKMLKTADEPKDIIVYCASGNRSSRIFSTYMEHRQGKVYHLNRGFQDWVRNNLPIKN